MIGLLWFDPDAKKSLPEKIGEAVTFYRIKYGGHPNVCLVNPKTLGEQAPAVDGIRVDASKSIQVNHFFVGIE